MRLPLAALVLFAGCGPRPTFVEPPLRPDVQVSPATAVLTWEKGINAQTTLVARTLGTVEATAPDGGLVVGDALGGGQVIAVTEGTTYTDNQLPDGCGPFAWHLWSRAADGTWAKSAATVRSLRGAHTIAPTAEVTALSSSFEGNTVRLSWMPPEASTAFEGVTVVRKRGSAPSSVLDGTSVYSGPSSTVTEPLSALSPSAPTYYAVFNCNACGKCGASAPSLAISAPGDGGATLSISGLSAQLSADGQRVELSWTSGAPTVKVLRTHNATASGPHDANAVVVFDGAGSAVDERVSVLLPDLPLETHRYTYTAWGCIGATCSTTPASTPFRVTLRQSLRGGGYALYFRHATATTCVDQTSLGTASTTASPNWWKRCDASCATATAAQLTPATADGQLAAVRDFFADAGVAVSQVQTSEFCRAVQTAAGFSVDAGIVETVPALTYFVYEENNRCRDTAALLNGMPAAGTNRVLVGHGDFASSCAVLDSLEPAEAAIYKPQLGAPPRYLARVGASQWATLP
ncbi:MAG: hypothetical protein ACOZQL_42265 [Myxococcota bacterium]